MEQQYFVVVNDEEQYSIWDATQAVPSGWTTVGEPDTKERCLETVERLWVDMRPLSARR